MEWLQHFDPNPQWYLWSLHTITIISTPIYAIGMFCILKVDISSNSSVYKYLLALNITWGFVIQLMLSVGTIPILVLPGLGGYPLGFMQYLGIPTCLQTSAVVVLLAGLITAGQQRLDHLAHGYLTVILFCYRNHVLLPLSKAACIIINSYGVFTAFITPPILNTIVCLTTDNNKTVDGFKKQCPDTFALIPSAATRETLLILELNALLYGVLYYYIFLIFQGVFWIGLYAYRIAIVLRRQIVSSSALAMHKTVVRCLLIQTIVYYGLFLVPAFLVIYAFHATAELSAVANLGFIVISLSDPACVLSMIFSHKKYRTAVLRVFHKEEETPKQVLSTTSRKSRQPV